MRNIIKYYPLTCVLVLTIWVLCMMPVPELPVKPFRFIDKWTHFVMYAALSMTVWMEQWMNKRRREDKGIAVPVPRIAVIGVLCPIVMGILVEFAQAYLTTYRGGDWKDALCNSIGVCIGSSIAYLIRKVINRRR